MASSEGASTAATARVETSPMLQLQEPGELPLQVEESCLGKSAGVVEPPVMHVMTPAMLRIVKAGAC